MNNILDLLKQCGLYNIDRISDRILEAQTDPESLPDVVECLVKKLGLHFGTCLGIDLSGLGKSGKEVIYLLTIPDHGKVLIVKTLTSERGCIRPTYVKVPAAKWCELEYHDLVGVKLCDVPSGRFMLPDSMVENYAPLCKLYTYSERRISTKSCLLSKHPEGYVELFPHHPYFYEHEDIFVEVKDGKIVDVYYRGFYNHRGIEKLGESRLRIDQLPFLAERICGICGFTHSTAVCQAIESALRIEVPDRARLARTLMLEIERIESHLLWIGLMCYALGRKDLFLKVMKVREFVMYMCDVLVGNRKMYGLNTVGGVRELITRERVDKIRSEFPRIREEILNTLKLVEDFPELRQVRNVGVLSRDDAHILGAVGPVARASGIKYDVRKALPYAAYNEVSFSVPVLDEGDVYARYVVRVLETRESLDIVEQVLYREELVQGPAVAEYEFEEGKVGIGITEAPRGENIHFIVTGRDMRAYRWKVRAPTYANLHVLPKVLIGQELRYANVIVLSLDPCLSCTDRLVFLKR